MVRRRAGGALGELLTKVLVCGVPITAGGRRVICGRKRGAHDLARLVEDGWRLFRLDQEWVYKHMREPWMPGLIAALARKAIEAPPKTLVLLDVNRVKYERHVRHWMECADDARVRTYRFETIRLRYQRKGQEKKSV